MNMIPPVSALSYTDRQTHNLTDHLNSDPAPAAAKNYPEYPSAASASDLQEEWYPDTFQEIHFEDDLDTSYVPQPWQDWETGSAYQQMPDQEPDGEYDTADSLTDYTLSTDEDALELDQLMQKAILSVTAAEEGGKQV